MRSEYVSGSGPAVLALLTATGYEVNSSRNEIELSE